MTKGILDDKRIFFSACELGNQEFSDLLKCKNPNMNSFIAMSMKPELKQLFPFWTTFFYMMDAFHKKVMKSKEIIKSLTLCATIFEMDIYCSYDGENPETKENGWHSKRIKCDIKYYQE